MPSDTLEPCPSTVVKNDELARFCAYMAEGLHAMAQPLTILRSTVAASAAPGVTPAGQRRYLELSTQHVERTCGLFECLQDLVIASHVKADRGPVELLEVLALVVEDHKALLETSAIELRVLVPDGLLPVLGDAARTMQALSAALKVAASVSSPGSVIELQVTARNGLVELMVQNMRIHGRSLNSSQRLTLVLAEANVRSQQGKFECTEDPFRVSITLPLQEGYP
jgi:signal transduction histidine kinase